MKRQRGLTLTALLVWGMIISLVAILGIRVAPDVIEYPGGELRVAEVLDRYPVGGWGTERRTDYPAAR